MDDNLDENIMLEKMLETIYYKITADASSYVCNVCPIINMLDDLIIMMRIKNNEQIASELGLEVHKLSCPFADTPLERKK